MSLDKDRCDGRVQKQHAQQELPHELPLSGSPLDESLHQLLTVPNKMQLSSSSDMLHLDPSQEPTNKHLSGICIME